MDIFSVDFTLNELAFLRQSLDGVTIKGADAKFLANLQIKLENEINEIHNLIHKEEKQKAESLQKVLEQEQVKASKKKS